MRRRLRDELPEVLIKRDTTCGGLPFVLLGLDFIFVEPSSLNSSVQTLVHLPSILVLVLDRRTLDWGEHFHLQNLLKGWYYWHGARLPPNQRQFHQIYHVPAPNHASVYIVSGFCFLILMNFIPQLSCFTFQILHVRSP